MLRDTTSAGSCWPDDVSCARTDAKRRLRMVFLTKDDIEKIFTVPIDISTLNNTDHLLHDDPTLVIDLDGKIHLQNDGFRFDSMSRRVLHWQYVCLLVFCPLFVTAYLFFSLCAILLRPTLDILKDEIRRFREVLMKWQCRPEVCKTKEWERRLDRMSYFTRLLIHGYYVVLFLAIAVPLRILVELGQLFQWTWRIRTKGGRTIYFIDLLRHEVRSSAIKKVEGEGTPEFFEGRFFAEGQPEGTPQCSCVKGGCEYPQLCGSCMPVEAGDLKQSGRIFKFTPEGLVEVHTESDSGGFGGGSPRIGQSDEKLLDPLAIQSIQRDFDGFSEGLTDTSRSFSQQCGTDEKHIYGITEEQWYRLELNEWQPPQAIQRSHASKDTDQLTKTANDKKTRGPYFIPPKDVHRRTYIENLLRKAVVAKNKPIAKSLRDRLKRRVKKSSNNKSTRGPYKCHDCGHPEKAKHTCLFVRIPDSVMAQAITNLLLMEEAAPEEYGQIDVDMIAAAITDDDCNPT